MKRLLLTGAHGQLGSALRSLLEARTDIVSLCTDADTLDITDREAVAAAVADFRPDFVVNAAAFTAVDKAEGEPEFCLRLNAEAVANIAEAARSAGAKVIHVSTDYVFDGKGTRPYKETDVPSPINVYGRTKLEGEQALLSLMPDSAVVLRTAWLYSITGKNFVKTMLTLAADRDEIGVVADQWGCPTFAPDLARAVMAVIDAERFHPGVYHVVGGGRTTWYDLTRAIFAEAGVTRCRVRPLTTEEYPTAARRPQYSVLDCSAFERDYGFRMPDWQTSLHSFFN